jgi:hypothetical protein
MLMLDLCSGNKTASAAFRDRGWNVVTLDIDPALKPDIVADVRFWSWNGPTPDFIWCSHPCTEFSRMNLPWIKNPPPPDLSIVAACKRIITETKPRYWVIVNVRNAIPYLGRPAYSYHPIFLWGNFPDPGRPKKTKRKKQTFSSSNHLNRAAIPYNLSFALAVSIETQLSFFDLLYPAYPVYPVNLGDPHHDRTNRTTSNPPI